MATDWASLIEPVARELLGEPNRALSSKHELRFGSHGSLSVDLKKGTYYDHEACSGGGTLALIEARTGRDLAGCVDWAREHGLAIEDERPARKPPSSANGAGLGTPVATYDYTDEAGVLLFQVLRFEPKTFRQRAPINDGWAWSVRGRRQVPYHLPELIEALANEHTVFVVEGEKDVDALRAIGVPATCNAGGVGKWRAELSEFFAGADVVVISDNDPIAVGKDGKPVLHESGRPKRPGQDHAHQVAAFLDGVAARVRVLHPEKFWPDCPEKGDVSDWIADGDLTPERLYEIADRLPAWTPGMLDEPPAPALLRLIDVASWAEHEPRERRWAVRNLIPDSNVSLLSGQGGIGKTLLMQQLSVATVLGRDWIGQMPEPGPVLFITAEDDENELHLRYDQIARHYRTGMGELAKAGLHLLSLAGKDAVMAKVGPDGIVRPTELFDTMVRTASEIRPKWIGLDTAADIFVVNERDRSQVRQCISLLRGLALAIETAVVLLAHPSLAGIASGTGLSGSTAWNNSVRSRLYLKAEKKKDGDVVDDEPTTTPEGEEAPDQDDGSVRILETMKSNYAGIGTPIRLIWRRGLLLPEPALPTSPIERAALEEKARTVFLALLERWNRQNMVVSYKERARNYAPTEFAAQPEARDLHKSPEKRKRLLRQAMDYLLAKDRIQTGFGPLGVSRSRQFECLYKAGTLL